MKYVGYALGQGLVALLQLGFRTLAGIGYMLAVLVRPLIERTLGRRQRYRASRHADVQRSVTTASAAPRLGGETVIGPVGAHCGHDFEAADRIVSLRLDPPVGVVNLRIFQARGVIKRDLIISEPRLRTLMKARRHSFPDVPYESAQGLEASKEEAVRLAERLINELGAQPGTTVRSGPRVGRAGVSVLPAPAGRQMQAPAEPGRTRPAEATRERLPDIAVLPARRLVPAYVGELVKAGSARVTPPDRPPFEVFEAKLALDNGSELALRGAELERELTASGCLVGQRIEITPMGKVPVTLANGIEAQKYLYRVRPAAAPQGD
ncbi:MAG: hypothetical protein JWQ76_5385 [Ramlibacter sp.]|nr:hypothetical protein [Ramlibacter sp.]